MSSIAETSPALLYAFTVTVIGSICSAIQFAGTVALRWSPSARLQRSREALDQFQSLVTSSDTGAHIPWVQSELLRLRIGVERMGDATNNFSITQWLFASAFQRVVDDIAAVKASFIRVVEENYARRSLPPNLGRLNRPIPAHVFESISTIQQRSIFINVVLRPSDEETL